MALTNGLDDPSLPANRQPTTTPPERRPITARGPAARSPLPVLLTVDETAELLRTTRRAIYIMVERGQLPGLTRIGRRVLFRADDLLDWLDRKRTSSPKE